MFGKEKMKGMSENAKKAKLTALKEAHGMAKKMMEDDLRGLKKVTVAADSPEGLKEGLEKAEDIVEGAMDEKSCEYCEGEGCDECDMESEDDSEDSEDEQPEMSADELEAKIAELMKMKEKLKK